MSGGGDDSKGGGDFNPGAIAEALRTGGQGPPPTVPEWVVEDNPVIETTPPWVVEDNPVIETTPPGDVSLPDPNKLRPDGRIVPVGDEPTDDWNPHFPGVVVEDFLPNPTVPPGSTIVEPGITPQMIDEGGLYAPDPQMIDEGGLYAPDPALPAGVSMGATGAVGGPAAGGIIPGDLTAANPVLENWSKVFLGKDYGV